MIRTFKNIITPKLVLNLHNWSLVTSSTPSASKPSEIKGVLGVIQQYYFASKLSPPLTLTTNKFFRCHYFPPDHILGIFRKSSPAIRLKFNDGFIANNPELAMSLKNRLPKSLVPADYSFIRVKLRRLYRKVFYDAYQKEGIDGLYVFYVDLIPDSPEEYAEFEREITRAVKAVAEIDVTSRFYTDIVMGANMKANWNYVRKLVEGEGLRYPKELILLGAKYQSAKTKKSPKKSKEISSTMSQARKNSVKGKLIR